MTWDNGDAGGRNGAMTTFGQKMLQLMSEQDLSLRRLAQIAYIDKGLLSKVSRGIRPPSEDVAKRLDEVLKANGELKALRSTRKRDKPSRASTPTADAIAPLELVGSLALPDRNGQPVNADFVNVIRETNQGLVKLDSMWGGHEVFPLALRVFKAANHKLGIGAYEPGIERDLMAATGETGEIAAWLAYDADRQSESRQIVHEALMLSRQAGDRDMELFELTHLAMQSLHLERPAEALRVATGALEQDLPPRVAALFEIRHGRALAQLADETGAFRALDRAKNVLSESISLRDPHWTWWINETELARHKATAYHQIGRSEKAVPLFEQVVEACRGRYLYGKLDLAQLLNALVHVGDWRRAEEIIGEIAALVDVVSAGRSASFLRKTFDEIRESQGVPSTVADIAFELGKILSAEKDGPR
ncbi:hypothetical protein [Actinomadura sp. 9N215]|uniref:hypothetical protein n=1 Tax=Actinomadura sp. 9N215 TaxID=3375150 RepID=UPI0037A7FE90